MQGSKAGEVGVRVRIKGKETLIERQNIVTWQRQRREWVWAEERRNLRRKFWEVLHQIQIVCDDANEKSARITG